MTPVFPSLVLTGVGERERRRSETETDRNISLITDQALLENVA